MTREMKDSGIEWIGQIPKDWVRCRVKDIAITLPKSNIQAGQGQTDGRYPLYTSSQIQDKYYNEAIYTGNTITMGTGGMASVNYVDKDFSSSTDCLNFKTTQHTKFLAYWLYYQKDDVINSLWFEGMGLKHLQRDKLFNSYLFMPEIKYQQKITNFLDSKCFQIDSILTSLQDQIDTLEQYKKSVITEAVTKGLNPDVEMKDSGIPWVGKVPSQWNIHPIFVYYYEGKNKNNACKENNLLSLSYGKIIRKDINTNEGLLPASFSTYNVVSKNDIIIRPTDLQNDKRSLRTGLVTETGIITSAYIDLKPYPFVNSKYYHYLLHSYDLMKVFYNMGNGVRQGLNFTEFSRLLVLEPSKSEQDQIVDFLNSQCSQIDSIISQKKEQMETLREYKKSLIYEYVTGKKEVPNA